MAKSVPKIEVPTLASILAAWDESKHERDDEGEVLSR